MKVFIIGRDLLTYMANLVKQLQRMYACEVVIVDNASSYGPLLDWYARECPCRVIRLPKNMGHCSPWTSGVIEREADRFYAVTDPDLDLEGVPLDCLDYLQWGLEKYDPIKAGLALRIDDIPGDNPLRDQIVGWERQFWRDPINGQWFRAHCDTTLAVYDKRKLYRPGQYYPAIRSNWPYVATHCPWLLSPSRCTPEFRYYLSHASSKTSWSHLMANPQTEVGKSESVVVK